MSPILNPDHFSDLQVLMSEEAHIWLTQKVEALKQKIKRLKKDLTILYDPGTFKQTADNVSAQEDLQMSTTDLTLKEKHLNQSVIAHSSDMIGTIKLGQTIKVQYLQINQVVTYILGSFYDSQRSLELKQKPLVIYFDSPLAQMAAEKGLNNPFVINGQEVQIVETI